ncbi:unnamed protein product [Withania somnifera]
MLFLRSESTQPPFSCDSSNSLASSFPFRNVTLPISQRVNDLVSRLTVDEKILQLWLEGLHGVSRSGKGTSFNGTIKGATQFPQVILSTSAFDENLWYRIALSLSRLAIVREASAVYNAGQLKELTLWAPNINIFRDPRWGRGQDTTGEDPMVVGKYDFEGVKRKHRYLQASARCKHFIAQNMDNWNNFSRYSSDAHSCVEQGKASIIMCAYNLANGIPNCANYDLLTTIAPGQWDCDAVDIMFTRQGYAKEPEDAVAATLKASMDVNCGSHLKKYTKSALEKQKIQESDIDRALHNIVSNRMRLGWFNGDQRKLVYGDISTAEVCSHEHRALALEAARNGIVLKNSNRLLPLSKMKTTSLAVISPKANDSEVLGNYESFPCKNVTLLKGLQGYVANTMYHPGCNFTNSKRANYVVLVMGLDQTLEQETLDRTELGLPGMQERLVTAIAQVALKPVILVLMCGGPVDVANYLSLGIPRSSTNDMRMRPVSPNGYPGRTYRFYNGPKVFEFGYGLGYTNYSYSFASVNQDKLHFENLKVNKATENCSVGNIAVSDIRSEACNKATMAVKVAVKNQGEMAGKNPVLLFLRHSNTADEVSRKTLIGFKSVNLEAGNIEFDVKPCEHFTRANRDDSFVIDEGKYLLLVGDGRKYFKYMAAKAKDTCQRSPREARC